MSFIASPRNLLALTILGLLLTAGPLFAQQDNSAPQQPASTQPAQQNTGAQAQPSSTVQAQPRGGAQAQPIGVTASSLVVAPAPKLPLPTGEDYSKGVRSFPNLFAPYRVRNVPEANFGNAPKLESMIQDGKIMLSLDDAIALALADNLDIAIARYNLPVADTDILRTKAGSVNFGVNPGLIQGTLGGGGIAATGGASGTGAGGTSLGSGGVGVGASGVVSSTLGLGPTPDSWDPIITGQLEEQHQIQPSLEQFSAAGAPSAVQNTFTENFTYSQGFSYGTLLTVNYFNERLIGNNAELELNPTLFSSFQMTVRQHLLQGWGWAIQRRYLTIARDIKRTTEESFRYQVSYTVSQIMDIYWDLVAAYEDVKVKERSLALDEKTLSDNRKQVEIGTMAPISVVQAESAVAADKQSVLTAHSTLQLQQLYVKNAISRNMIAGSDVMKAEIIPTDTVVVPEQEESIDVDALIKRSLEDRPDIIQQKLNLKDRLLSIQSVNNLLRPSVDLFAFYGSSSLAGSQNPVTTCAPGEPVISPITKQPQCVAVGSITPTGFSNTFTNLFNSSSPNKGAYVQITIPLRNRVAQAQQVRSQLEYRQAELSFKQLQNNLAIGIRNEVFTLEQDRAKILAAREAQTFAEQNLDAEQKKYALGASTSFNVMNMQSQLAIAQENTITAEINFAKARVLLDLDTAQTLDNNNIVVGEVVTGQIKTQPKAPGIGPNTFIEQTGQPSNPPNPQLTPRPKDDNTQPTQPPQQPPQ